MPIRPAVTAALCALIFAASGHEADGRLAAQRDFYPDVPVRDKRQASVQPAFSHDHPVSVHAQPASNHTQSASMQQPPRVVINEVQSSNNTTIADEDGDYEDWIELFNAGPDTVDLNGFGLSDDASRLWRWVFPAGTRLVPGEFLLVWASGKDRRDPSGPLHTSFQISSQGEEVLLSSFTVPAGQDSPVIDRLPPTAIPTDYSFGRYPDGVDQWRLFETPTPGAANEDSPWAGIAGPPIFSHRPGFYSDALDLGMDAGHPDAVIHYTTDGSTPTTGSPVFEGTLRLERRDHEPDVLTGIPTGPQFWVAPDEPVFKGHVIRAIAVRDGYRQSEVATGSWFIHPEGAGRYSFPAISLVTDPEHFFSDATGIMVPGDLFDPADIVFSGNYNERGVEWERPAHMTFFDLHTDPFAHHRTAHHGKLNPAAWLRTGGSPNQTVNVHDHIGDAVRNYALIRGGLAADLTDAGNQPLQGFAQGVGVRIHGGATRRYPQKSLRIYARSSYDWNPEITWPLFPGLRAVGTGEPLETWKRLILRSSGDDWFHTMFKDAMIQSLYEGRRIDRQATRPAVVFINGEYWGIHNIRERQDGWFVASHYGIDRDDVVILEDDAVLSDGVDADRGHYLAMRSFAHEQDLGVPENLTHLETQMDLDNYLAYKTFVVYTANADWPHNNVRFWRKRTDGYRPDAPYGHDGRWRWMIYDLDASFGFPYEDDAASWAQYDHDTIEWITGMGNPRVPQNWVNKLFNNLMDSPEFRRRFVTLLAGDLNTRLHPDFVTGRIAEFREVYALEIAEHLRRYTFSAGRSLQGWEGHIGAMEEFARRRPGYLRSFIMEHFDIADTVRLDLQVQGAASGHVVVGGIPIHKDTPGVPTDHSRWSGTYFQGVPLTVTAMASEGRKFLEWQDLTGEPFDFNEISVSSSTGPGDPSFTWVPEGDLAIVAVFENGEITGGEDREDIPDRFRVMQNYPNPFNNQTAIPYELPVRSSVTFEVHSVDGRMVRRFVKGVRDPGSHVLRLDADGMASGLYLYRMVAVPEGGSPVTVRPGRMTLVR
jgi:hypothetical protein